MKRLLAIVCPVLLLGGCVAVPYDYDSGYHTTYPATVTTRISGSYRYPEPTYPYAGPVYGYPYPVYPYPPPAPAYRPPAPVIVPPPTIEYRHERNERPGWQNQPSPSRNDQLRHGPLPETNQPGAPPLRAGDTAMTGLRKHTTTTGSAETVNHVTMTGITDATRKTHRSLATRVAVMAAARNNPELPAA